jgi:predicted phage-related endonuclease
VSLTPKQREMRRTGVTASESAAVLRWSPYRGPMEVWLAKPTPSRGPLLDVEDDDESPRAQAKQVGTFLEAGIRELVHARTKIRFRRATTLRHRTIRHILATPDGLGIGPDVGLEIKLVGARMAHHWEGDSIPDYVLSQSLVGMSVTRRRQWIVAALIGGTDLRLVSIERDEDLEGAVLEACSQFWIDHVQGDEPPEAETPEERRALIRARYPGALTSKVERVEAYEVAECMRWLTTLDMMQDALGLAREQLVAMLAEYTGARYGVETEAGKFLHYDVRGRVDWKAVAEELAGGAVSDDLIERHRGGGHRVPRFYAPKAQTKTRRLRP